MLIIKKDMEKVFCCLLMLDILFFVFKINFLVRDIFYYCIIFNMFDIGGKCYVIRVSYNIVNK